MSRAGTENEEGGEEIGKGLGCQNEGRGRAVWALRSHPRAVAGGRPYQVGFKRGCLGGQCAGWVCGRRRLEAGGPAARVEARVNKAQVRGEWSCGNPRGWDVVAQGDAGLAFVLTPPAWAPGRGQRGSGVRGSPRGSRRCPWATGSLLRAAGCAGLEVGTSRGGGGL